LNSQGPAASRSGRRRQGRRAGIHRTLKAGAVQNECSAVQLFSRHRTFSLFSTSCTNLFMMSSSVNRDNHGTADTQRDDGDVLIPAERPECVCAHGGRSVAGVCVRTGGGGGVCVRTHLNCVCVSGRYWESEGIYLNPIFGTPTTPTNTTVIICWRYSNGSYELVLEILITRGWSGWSGWSTEDGIEIDSLRFPVPSRDAHAI
jgi:hypothetical protein